MSEALEEAVEAEAATITKKRLAGTAAATEAKPPADEAAAAQEKQLIDIVSVLQNDSGTAANLLDVLTEAERRDIPRSKAEDIIDKLCRDGRMMRPSGYDTLQIV